MLSFFARRKQRKSLKELLHFAHRVWSFRRDVIPEAAADDIYDLYEGIKERAKAKSCDLNSLTPDCERLRVLLKTHGGKIYPQSSWTENVDMIVVAAIIALGIRGFFFQTFQIPTNSMYPTYHGMIGHLYAEAEASPSVLGEFGRTLQLGASHYELTAPSTGEVRIPLFPPSNGLSSAGVAQFEHVQGRKWFGLLPEVRRRYTIYVGSDPAYVEVPLEFNLDDLLCQAYFPEYETLGEAARQAVTSGKVDYYEHPEALLMHTTASASKGDAFLRFDILAGDTLFVNRYAYNFSAPKVGDPIVFRTGEIPGINYRDESYYIKRLVGLPGDVLNVQLSTLYRNGKPITGSPVFEKNANKEGLYPGYRAAFRLSPGSVEHIPPHSFYGMGDNSPFSGDSRIWGFIPEKEVVGKASFIFYPFTERWGFAK